MNINRSLDKIASNNTEIFNLQKELVLLRIKQKTKQSVKTHLFRKIKHKIVEHIKSKA